MDVPQTVAEKGGGLEANPDTLTRNVAQDVTFTVKVNGVALPNASATFTSNSNFTNLPPAAQAINASGQIAVNNLGDASFPVSSGITDSNGQVTLIMEGIISERTLDARIVYADSGYDRIGGLDGSRRAVCRRQP